MEDQEKKKILFAFLKQQKLGVMATVTAAGAPEAAVLEFAQNQELEIIFGTFSIYRKYKNMQQNPQVAWVFGWDEGVTVQYEGIAAELAGEELLKYKAALFSKLPEAKRFDDWDEIKYFKVTPIWIRYADYSIHPWNIF